MRVRTWIAVGGSVGAGLMLAAPAQALAPGDFDTSFASSGLLLAQEGLGPTSSSSVNALALQPDGRIVLVGQATDTAGFDSFAALRLSADGSSDPTWNGGSPVIEHVDATAASEFADAVAVQPDGAIAVGGQYADPNDTFSLLGLTSAGALDSTFGGGPYINGQGGAVSAANGVGVEQNGDIVAAGYTTVPPGNATDELVCRTAGSSWQRDRGMRMAFEGSGRSGPNVWFVRDRGLDWESADG
jgi:uncharacterized delta-60 repeat protein